MTLAFWAVWILCVGLSGWLYRALAGGTLSPTKINYFSVVFWLGLMIFTMPGALIVALGAADDLFFIQPIASDHAAKTWAFYMICWAAVAVPFASLLTLALWRKEPRRLWDTYLKIPLDDQPLHGRSPWVAVLASLLVVYCLLFIVVQISTHPSPLFLSIKGASELEIAQRRIEVTRMYEGAKPVKSFLNLLGPVLLFSCVAHGFSPTTKNRTSRVLAYIVGLLVAISTLTDSEKAPILYLLLGVTLVLVYVGRKPSPKALALVVGLTLCVMVLSYMLFYRDLVDGGWLLDRLSERIFVAQMSSVPLCAAEYPRYSPFIGFGSLDSILNKPLGIVPELRASELLMVKYFPGLASSGGWNVNGFFIHEAWANFGLGGVALAPFLVGAIHSSSVLLFTHLRKSPAMVGLFAYFSADITLFITGLNRYIFNTGLVHIIALVLLIEVLHRGFKHYYGSILREAGRP